MDNDPRVRDVVSAWSWLPMRVAGIWIRAAATVVFALVAYGLFSSRESWKIAYLPADATIEKVTPNCTATEVAAPQTPQGKARKQISGNCQAVAAKVAAMPDRSFSTVRHSTSVDLGFVTAAGKPVRASSHATTLGLADDVQPGSSVRIFYQNTAPERIRLSDPGLFETLGASLALLGLLLVSGFIAFYRRR